jgi:uncharacterized membrane protein YeaQ/YmgE (transglycosylase-associated protein family)
MSGTIINLIIQIIAGAVGGHAAGAASETTSLGPVGNTIAGAVGGGIGGQILTALLPLLQNTAGNVDMTALAGQAVGGDQEPQRVNRHQDVQSKRQHVH